MIRVPASRQFRMIATGMGAAALMAVAAPLLAQSEAEALPEGNSPEEVAQRKAANEEQLRLAQQQLGQNEAGKEAYDQSMTAYQQEVARYEQQKAEADRLAREHEAAMAKWEADVAACNAGDRSHCAPMPED